MPETQNVAIALANRSIGIRSNIQNPLAVQMLREFGLDKPMAMPLDASRPVTVKINAAGQLECLRVSFEGPFMPDVARAIDEWNAAPADKNGLTKLQNAVLWGVQHRLLSGPCDLSELRLSVRKILMYMVRRHKTVLPPEAHAGLFLTTLKESQARLVEAMAAVDACAGSTREETPRKVLNMLEATIQVQHSSDMFAPAQPVPEMPAWRNLLRQPDLQLQGRELRPDEVTVCRPWLIDAALHELRRSGRQARYTVNEYLKSGWGDYYLEVNKFRQFDVLDALRGCSGLAKIPLQKKLENLRKEELAIVVGLDIWDTHPTAKDIYVAAKLAFRPGRRQARIAESFPPRSPGTSPASRFASQKTQDQSRGWGVPCCIL